MTSSEKKFSVTLSVALISSITLMYNNYDMLGPIIGLALVIIGINRHYFAKCKKCESWRTHTKIIEAYEGGPGIIRRCSKCGHADVIDGSVMMVESKTE